MEKQRQIDEFKYELQQTVQLKLKESIRPFLTTGEIQLKSKECKDLSAESDAKPEGVVRESPKAEQG